MKIQIIAAGGTGREVTPEGKVWGTFEIDHEKGIDTFTDGAYPTFLDGKPFMGEYKGDAELVWQVLIYDTLDNWVNAEGNNVEGLMNLTRQILNLLPPVQAHGGEGEKKKVHELKTVQPFFDMLRDGSKKFELRKNDRGFKLGDRLILKEYDVELDSYSGRYIPYDVTAILENYQGLEPGYCVMSIKIATGLTKHLT